MVDKYPLPSQIGGKAAAAFKIAAPNPNFTIGYHGELFEEWGLASSYLGVHAASVIVWFLWDCGGCGWLRLNAYLRCGGGTRIVLPLRESWFMVLRVDEKIAGSLRYD